MLVPTPVNCDPSVKKAIQKLAGPKLGMGASPTFAGLTLTGLTASRLIWSDANKALASKDLVDLVAGTANEINITDDGDGSITVGIVDPLIVAKGGSGAASFTDHSILLGSDTGAFTALGLAANGQIPIGFQNSDPVLATITGTANQITVTNGAGSIGLALPQDIHTGASPTFANLNLTETGSNDPTITFTSATNSLGMMLDESATYDMLHLDGKTAGADTAVCIQALSGRTARFHLEVGAEANRTQLLVGSAYHFTLQNMVEDADIIFGVDDGGVAKTIKWDASVDKLIHSAGTFNFDAGHLTTTGNLTAGNYTAANKLTACATNAGALDFSAATKTLTVAESITVGAVIDDLNSLTPPASDGQFIVATGAGAFAYESGATARTSLGLGTGDSPEFTAVSIGNADTTITRVSGGVIAVEGTTVMLVGDAATAHALLDGSVHSDSVADTISRGSLIYGNATPKWDELDISTGFLRGDGTDCGWLSYANSLAAMSGQAGAAFAWNSQNLTGIGTIGCGAVTGTSTAVFEGASVTVGKASTTTGTLVLHDSNSANTITLTVPDISAGSLTFTLPPTDGANTNVLQTDGNGVLTWVAAGGAHTHDGDTLQLNAVNSNGGAFAFDTTGEVTFNQTVNATFAGNITGNVTGNTSGSSGSCTGLSATATALATARSIGGVNFDGTAAITPTTIVVADTTDTSCFVGLWESATGNLLPKTDGGLTYNAGTAALTTTTFVGALTGQADTVATITGLAPDTATTQATQASITTCVNLTTVGTIATGTWEATDVAVGHGGTGASTAGDARTNLGLAIGTNVLAQQTIGIADNNLLEVDSADAASGEYCKLTGDGVESKTGAEVITDLETAGLGAWTSPAYDAGNFTGNGSMTWTVSDADERNYQYMIIGKTMWVKYYIEDTTVAGTLNTALQIAIPASKTAAKNTVTLGVASDNGGAAVPALVQTLAGQQLIYLYKNATGSGNWAASTNNTHVWGSVSFEIQ